MYTMELHCIFNDQEHTKELEFAKQNSARISDDDLFTTIVELEEYIGEVEEHLERDTHCATLSDDDVADYAKNYWRAKFLLYYLRARLPVPDEELEEAVDAAYTAEKGTEMEMDDVEHLATYMKAVGFGEAKTPV